MNFYAWHIGDYKSHTDHLTPKEDICYRRILDHYYLHETPILDDMPALARHVKMRDSEEVIHAILVEFFELRGEYWHSTRADKEIAAYLSKSEKARKSARSRWSDANAMRTQCEGNATLVCEGNATITNTSTNTNTNTNNTTKQKSTRKKKAFSIPTPKEVSEYAKTVGYDIDAEKFCNHYEMRGWMVSREPMKSWEAAVRTWKSNQKNFGAPTDTSFVKEV